MLGFLIAGVIVLCVEIRAAFARRQGRRK